MQTLFTKHPFAVKAVQLTRNGFYASLDDKNLVLFDRGGKQRLFFNFFEYAKVHIVTCFTYITRYRVYVVVTADFRMFIMSEYFDVIRVMQLGSGRVQDLEYLEQTDELLVCGINSLKVMRLNIQAKYDIESAIMLDPTGRSMQISLSLVKEIDTKLHWIRGSKIQLPYVILWSEGEISKVSLETHETTMILRDLCQSTSITTVIFSERFQVFAVGTFIGSICLYKGASQTRLNHTFEAHSRPVTALALHKDSSMFLSAASDMTIKIWSYYQYAMMYSFTVNDRPSQPLTDIIFLTLDSVVLCFENRIQVFKLNYLAEFFALLKSPIRKILMLGSRVGILCDDNSCVMTDEQGQVSCTIFPPPGALAVLAVDYIPEIDRVVMLLDSGSFAVIRCTTDTGILEQIVNRGDITVGSMQDTSGSRVQFRATALKVVRGRFPIYDPDIALKTLDPKNAKVFVEHNFKSNTFVAVAAGKGALILLHIELMTIVHTRYSAHREQIISVEQVGDHLLTICQQHRLIVSAIQISSYNANEIVVLKKIDLRQPIDHIMPINDSTFLITLSIGDMEVYRINDGLVRLDYSSDAEHETTIATVAIDVNSALIASAANDTIKIWTFSKQALEEVKYVDVVSSVCFMDGALLVAHKSTVSKISPEAYSKPRPPEVIADEIEVHDYLRADLPTNLETEPTTYRSLNSETSDDSYFEVKNVGYRRQALTRLEDELGVDEKIWNKAVQLYERKKVDPSPFTIENAVDRSDPIRAAQRKKIRKNRKPKKKDAGDSAKKYQHSSRKRLEVEIKSAEEYIKAITVPIRSQSPKKRNQPAKIYTRRQLTEEKIIANVIRFGDPADRVDTRGLCVDMEPPDDNESEP